MKRTFLVVLLLVLFLVSCRSVVDNNIHSSSDIQVTTIYRENDVFIIGYRVEDSNSICYFSSSDTVSPYCIVKEK